MSTGSWLQATGELRHKCCVTGVSSEGAGAANIGGVSSLLDSWPQMPHRHACSAQHKASLVKWQAGGTGAMGASWQCRLCSGQGAGRRKHMACMVAIQEWPGQNCRWDRGDSGDRSDMAACWSTA